jgi:hypothetical protein
MDRAYITTLTRLYFPLALLVTFSALLVVGAVLDVTTAITGLYSVAGVSLAAVVYYATGRETSRSGDRRPRLPWRWCLKGTVLVFLFVVAYSGLTGDRLPALLVGLPVGYTLLALGLSGGVTDGAARWVPAIAVLFAAAPVSKLLTTGFYIGNGDYRVHVPVVRTIVSTGSLDNVVSSYRSFPGLHLLTSVASLLTGQSPYPTMVVLGILLYALVLVSVIFVLARLVTGSGETAVCVTLGVALISAFPFYSTYVFPQSFGVLLYVVFLYLAFLVGTAAGRRVAAGALLAVVGTTLVVTHHLTILLFIPAVGVLYLTAALYGRLSGAQGNTVTPSLLPLAVVSIAAPVYWSVRGSEFLYALSVYGWRLLELDIPTDYDTLLFTLGTASQPPSTVRNALFSLLHPDGIHFALLVSLVALGGISFLVHWEVHTRDIGLLVPGFLASVVVVQTPVPVLSIQRLDLVAAVFVVFIVGVALKYSLVRSSPSRTGLIILIVVATATATPLVHAGDDLYQLHVEPQPQRSFEEGEYARLSAAGEFTRVYGSTALVGSATRDVFRVRGVPASVRGVTVSESGVHVRAGLFVYRDNWADHLVYFGTQGLTPSGSVSKLRKVLFGDGYVERLATGGNQVYDAGSVGVLWRASGGHLGDSKTPVRDRGVGRNLTARESRTAGSPPTPTGERGRPLFGPSIVRSVEQEPPKAGPVLGRYPS